MTTPRNLPDPSSFGFPADDAKAIIKEGKEVIEKVEKYLKEDKKRG